MLQLLYNLGVRIYGLGVYLASLWIKKAYLWKQGRKQWREILKTQQQKVHQAIWFHAASSGEFEQAKPIIQWLKNQYPHQNILVTFFSPSGYELCKNYALVDFITYLPSDTPQNANDFLDIVQPKMAIFIKYEFWLNFLFAIRKKKIPCLLISGIFRKNSPFFQGVLKKLYQKALNSYTHIFVQNQESYENLKPYCELSKITLAGDTRFDRVIEICENWEAIKEIESYLPAKPIFMFGSSWPADELWAKKLYNLLPNWNFVLVPHEISELHNQQLRSLFPDAIFYSDIVKNAQTKPKRVLVIDKMGWLSRLYHYADAVWIGGGFGVGIHNTLEAAVYGKPIFFGPNYHKFHEAYGLIKVGAAVPVKTDKDIPYIIQFLSHQKQYKQSGDAAKNYVYSKQGATKKITHWIQNFLIQS